MRLPNLHLVITTAMGFHQPFGQRQAETGAFAALHDIAAFRLAEFFLRLGDIGAVHADARVGDQDAQRFIGRHFRADGDRAACFGEFVSSGSECEDMDLYPDYYIDAQDLAYFFVEYQIYYYALRLLQWRTWRMKALISYLI